MTTRWISRRLETPELPTFERITFREAAVGGARFTPDRRVVFSASLERRPEEVYAYVPGSPGLQPLGILHARLAAVSSKTGDLGLLMRPTSFFAELTAGTLARVPAVGGVPRELAEQVAWADWTGSGELAVVRRGPGGMWIERPLGTKVWEGAGYIAHLRCSPDGEQLAFFHHPKFGRSEMIVLDRSNTPHVVLTSSTEPGYSLAWTPDGNRLRFTAADRSGTNLSSVSLRGDVRLLYRFPEPRFLLDIAPDGTMIFSVSDRVKHIALKRPGQPSQRELAWLGPFPGIADLSLDGRTLLFMDWHPTDIHALLGATDGTPPKLLGAGLPLALSPDGRRVAMTSRDQHGLFLVPTGAGTTEEVPVSSLVVGSGQWSRDGHRLWIVARHDRSCRLPTLSSRRSNPKAP